jgi:peroxiredoxin
VELPRLEPLWKKYGDKGLSIVAIEATRDRERAVKFIEKYGLTYHLLEAEEDKAVVKKKFGVKWFPTSYLIDKAGRILICHVGFKAGDEVALEKEIIEMLGAH